MDSPLLVNYYTFFVRILANVEKKVKKSSDSSPERTCVGPLKTNGIKNTPTGVQGNLGVS